MSKNLLLVGCGKMGSAMLEGWLDAGKLDQCIIVEKNAAVAARFRDWDEVTIITDPATLPDPSSENTENSQNTEDAFTPDIIIFAVKPQIMDEILPQYRRFVRPQTVFLSIAAGKSIDYLASYLGEDAAVIRAMPNIAAAVRAGITVCVENPNVTKEEHEFAEYLLNYVGKVEWISDETLLDAVTAISGSGPAYVFLLIETLSKAGETAGLPPKLAANLARATIIGAGQLTRNSPLSATRLREDVTSAGGTTAAALEILQHNDALQTLINQAVQAAKARSQDLAG